MLCASLKPQAMDILEKRSFPRETLLSTALVNRQNARIMQMQTLHISTLDAKIEKLNGQLDAFLSRYSAQRMFLYDPTISVSVV